MFDNQCCGIDCTTPYCPNCGKRQHRMSLMGLLNHCIHHTQRLKAKGTEGAPLEKWQAWTEQLTQLLIKENLFVSTAIKAEMPETPR